MWNGLPVISSRCLPPSPLPGIGTVLSPRGDDLDPPPPSGQWPPVGAFDGTPLLGDFLGPNSFLEMWENNSRKGEEYIGAGTTNLSAEEGRCRVERSASALGITIDPISWTREETMKWLRHVMRLNHSSPGLIAEEDWTEDGKGLCEMTVEEFNHRLPMDGQLLHTELELWKTVFEVQIMSGYNPVQSPPMGFLGEDFWRDPGFVCSPIYANLETAEAPGNTYLQQVDHQKYMTTPPNLLYTDPNLQQVSVICEQPTVGGKINSHYEYNYNNNNCNNNNNNNNTIVVKAEQLGEDFGCSADDSSNWAMENSETLLASKPQLRHKQTGLQQQKKWPLMTHLGESCGVTGVMPDVVPSVSHRRGKRTITLWQFLKELLYTPFPDPAPIRWVDRNEGVFKIDDSVRVARLWGERKNRPTMNYDKLSRSIRQYYKKGIIKKTTNSKRLVYQFCPRFM